MVGGIGPQATMDFEARVHEAARQRLEPDANGGCPPMIVYYHRRPPFVLGDDGVPRHPLRLDSELTAALGRVGPMVDFVVITSNGPHQLREEIERAAGRPVLSMVELTLEEVRRREWSRVGVLTMGRPTLYTEPLERMGFASEVLEEATQARLNRAILRVMEGGEDDEDRRVARLALETLRRRGVDGVILGCTELPMLLRPAGTEPDLVNPVQILAEAAVEFAMR